MQVQIERHALYLSECVSCPFFDALCEGGRKEGGRSSVSVVRI